MTQYVMSALEFGPIVMERVIGQLDPTVLDQPTSSDRFTPREVIAHLADWEPILHGRIKQTVDRPGSTLVAYDEGERAVQQNYAAADPAESAKSFIKHRAETVAYLKTLDKADWDKASVHPERGSITVREWASALVGHDMYHIEQLTSVWNN
jgi:hypothetical protein